MEYLATIASGKPSRLMSVARTLRTATHPRIVCKPELLGGEPTVRGPHIAVRTIVIAYQGWKDVDRILHEYPQLNRADGFLTWIGDREDHRSTLHQWNECQQALIHGYRPAGFTEDDVRLALAWGQL